MPSLAQSAPHIFPLHRILNEQISDRHNMTWYFLLFSPITGKPELFAGRILLVYLIHLAMIIYLQILIKLAKALYFLDFVLTGANIPKTLYTWGTIFLQKYALRDLFYSWARSSYDPIFPRPIISKDISFSVLCFLSPMIPRLYVLRAICLQGHTLPKAFDFKIFHSKVYSICSKGYT